MNRMCSERNQMRSNTMINAIPLRFPRPHMKTGSKNLDHPLQQTIPTQDLLLINLLKYLIIRKKLLSFQYKTSLLVRL